jgi:hypothetical protein
MLCKWCVTALATCASSEIKCCVIVMEQQYCWVFRLIVFVGNGWLEVVIAHLPHLRLLDLERCDRVCPKIISELVAALPERAVINSRRDIVGAQRNELRETFNDIHNKYVDWV